MPKIINKALAVVVVLFCAHMVWQKMSDDRQYKSWPTAQARLISAEVVVSAKRRYFLVETTYDFMVDGKLYRSDLNKIGVPRFATDTAALAYLEELKSRREHIVHYHPRTPEKNTLAH